MCARLAMLLSEYIKHKCAFATAQLASSKKRCDLQCRGEDLTAALWLEAAQFLAPSLQWESSWSGQQELTPISIDAGVELFDAYCAAAVGAQIDKGLLRDFVVPICVGGDIECSNFFIKILARSDLVNELLGQTLAKQLKRFVDSQDFGMPFEGLTADHIFAMSQEIVETRQQFTRLKASALTATAPLSVEVVGESLVLTDQRKTSDRREHNTAMKTSTAYYVLKSKLAFVHVPTSVALASQLVLQGKGFIDNAMDEDVEKLDFIKSDRTIARHMLHMDSAIDMCTADEIMALREAGNFHGATFCTDGSPPSATRYAGLNFQITIVYFLKFAPCADWEAPEYDDKFPFTSQRHLCDIVNSPVKTGLATMGVIDKQLGTKGLSRHDLFAACGDGGEECWFFWGPQTFTADLTWVCGEAVPWTHTMACMYRGH